MAIAANLFKAILAMDSFYRGYDAGISGLSDATGTALGLATIDDSKGDAAAQNISFYAVAYDVGNVSGFSAGETVISFRGTDNLAADLLAGYGLGGGWPDSPQSFLAVKF